MYTSNEIVRVDYVSAGIRLADAVTLLDLPGAVEALRKSGADVIGVRHVERIVR